jgi:hypothetical protein
MSAGHSKPGAGPASRIVLGTFDIIPCGKFVIAATNSKLQPGFKSPDLLLPGFSNRALTPVWFSSGSDDKPLAKVSQEVRKFVV